MQLRGSSKFWEMLDEYRRMKSLPSIKPMSYESRIKFLGALSSNVETAHRFAVYVQQNPFDLFPAVKQQNLLAR